MKTDKDLLRSAWDRFLECDNPEQEPITRDFEGATPQCLQQIGKIYGLGRVLSETETTAPKGCYAPFTMGILLRRQIGEEVGVTEKISNDEFLFEISQHIAECDDCARTYQDMKDKIEKFQQEFALSDKTNGKESDAKGNK